MLDGHQSGQNYDDQQASCYQSNFDFDYYKNLLQREQAKEVVTNSCRERSDPCGIQDSKLVRKVKDDAASVEIRNDGSRVAKNESGTKSSARTSKNSERSENCVLLDNHGFIFPSKDSSTNSKFYFSFIDNRITIMMIMVWAIQYYE